MLWHSKSRDEIFSELDTSEEGLPQEEAKERLEKEGENRIESGDSTSPLKIFISQFQDNLIYLLMAAALLSVGIGLLPGHQPEYAEAGIIMLILFANGTFGFIQDYRAEKSIEALKKMSTPAAMVMRDGEKVEVDSTEIVPGDIIFLEQGDAVPADARLLEAESLDTDESALTGESNNVSKDPGKVEADSAVADRSNMVFMDTHVVRGRGKAVVTDTGMDTEVGDIAEEISDADDKETPFQEEVDEMGRKIGALVIGIVALVAVIQLSITGAGMITVLLMAIGLSVAAIPESLPAIVTLTLALGSKKLLKKNALVRRLPVVEALGSVNYIVTDKTGTLTEGVMTVENLYYQGENFEVTGTGTSTEGKFMKDGEEVDTEYLGPILECGVYCNNAEKTGEKSDKDFRGEPTEIALLVSGMKAGLKPDKERKRSIPFSSDRKRMTTVTEDGKAYMKGAPETVLERCDRILIDGEEKELTDQKKDEIIDQNHEYAREALRVLGFAHKEVEGDEDDEEVESGMVFLGLQGMMDPAREEVKDAVEDCRTAGIGVVMATGDNIETAKAIGKELGFNPEGALTGPEIDEMSDKELEEKVTEVEIFARVTPQHKVRISKALQSQDYNVAMTGDGVNDAPALKNSDVGIAMGQRGTDVAKKSSDMVLQDDNFVTIRDAISEGRAIFDNIRKVTNQLLSTNSGEVMFVFLGTLIGGLFYPEQFAGADAVVLTAVMILWVNFASDGPPAIALGEDPKVKGIMERNPRDPDESIIDKKILYMIAVTGPLAAIIMLPLFFMNIENMMLAQTILFMALAFFELLMFQVIRRDYGLKLWDNKYLIAAILASTLLHLSIIYTPIAEYFGVVQLGLQHWGYIAASLLVFWVIEVGFRRLLSRRYGNRINELGK
ncbi:ATPase, P-type (transporting), HAD superfamily, subfamily IC [Candidatus Haloredivivus sp. G17]|nr:ATPase, P-type (transporting), HAD superfamily, subfamily IC [Candidatus Haloredivivus sp. G17]